MISDFRLPNDDGKVDGKDGNYGKHGKYGRDGEEVISDCRSGHGTARGRDGLPNGDGEVERSERITGVYGSVAFSGWAE